jgi:ATP-dependent DNA ligase
MRAFDIETARQRLPAAADYVISCKIDGEFTCLLHSLLLAVPIDEDSFQLVGRVGGGFSDELRASLLQQLAERLDVVIANCLVQLVC